MHPERVTAMHLSRSRFICTALLPPCPQLHSKIMRHSTSGDVSMVMRLLDERRSRSSRSAELPLTPTSSGRNRKKPKSARRTSILEVSRKISAMTASNLQSLVKNAFRTSGHGQRRSFQRFSIDKANGRRSSKVVRSSNIAVRLYHVLKHCIHSCDIA